MTKRHQKFISNKEAADLICPSKEVTSEKTVLFLEDTTFLEFLVMSVKYGNQKKQKKKKELKDLKHKEEGQKINHHV